MTNPSLPISRLVSVAVVLEPPAPKAEDVDTCLVVGTSNVIDSQTRMRTYESIGAVAADFGTTAPEYLASVLWFEQNPAPTTLNIGRWVSADSPGMLFGGPQPTLTYASFTGITNGAFMLPVNGFYLSLNGLNFSSVTNLNGVASIIQTAALAATTPPFDSLATVVWDGVYERFELASELNNTSSSVGFAVAPTATGYYTFTDNVSPSDTLTLNGTVVTYVATSPGANQVQIGATVAATVVNTLTFLSASADTQLIKFKYAIAAGGQVLSIAAAAIGAGGNSLTIAKSGTNITVSGSTLSGGSGTDISTLLGLRQTSSGIYAVPGLAAETALQAVTILDNDFGNRWYGLTVLGAADSDVLAVAAYIEADQTSYKHFYGVTTQEAGVLVATDTSNVAYQLQQLKYKHTAVQYSSTNAYAVVSLLARILTTDWQANNSTITLMYKQEPGIVAETLNSAQANAVQGFNCNVFIGYNNNTAIIQYGTCASGDYIDTIIGMDWLALTLQAAWYAALYDAPTKIPQTDAGMHVLATVAEQTMGLAVNNGLLAPGVWNSGGFGVISQGSYLAKGYYVFQPSVNSQPQSQRVARKSVPFQIAVKLAGAVQTIDGTIFVNS